MNFFKVGLYTLGGAYAMLPVAERILVEQAQLISEEELHESFTAAQTLPGVIGANIASIIGNRKYGFLGAFSALMGVISPSIIIVSIIAAFFVQIENLAVIQKAFTGIRIFVLALLTNAAIKFGKKSLVDVKTVVLFFITFVVLYFEWIQPIFLIIAAAVFGVIVSLCHKKVRREG